MIKNICRIWKDLEDFSAKPTEKECASRYKSGQIEQIEKE